MNKLFLVLFLLSLSFGSFARQACSQRDLQLEGILTTQQGCNQLQAFCNPLGGWFSNAPLDRYFCSVQYCCGTGTLAPDPAAGAAKSWSGPGGLTCSNINNLSLWQNELSNAGGCLNQSQQAYANPESFCISGSWPSRCGCTYYHQCSKVYERWLVRNRPDVVPDPDIEILRKCSFSSIDEFKFVPEKNSGASNSPYKSLSNRFSMNGIEFLKILSRFPQDPGFSDTSSSKLFGFADGLYRYADNSFSALRGYVSDNDELDFDIPNSNELAPHKGHSARVAYAFNNGKLQLRAYFYNNLVRRSTDIIDVPWNRCFLASISISNSPIGRYITSSTGSRNEGLVFSRTRGSKQDTEPVALGTKVTSTYNFNVKYLDDSGKLVHSLVVVPRELAPLAEKDHKWPLAFSALSFVDGIKSFFSFLFGVQLENIKPAWNGGHTILSPFHGGGKPAKSYSIFFKEIDRREVGLQGLRFAAPAPSGTSTNSNTKDTKSGTGGKFGSGSTSNIR